MILALIGRIGIGGGTGHVIEYTGSAMRALSMEERMTVCNMTIEAGARAGMVAPDDTTFEYLAGRPYAPQGAAWERAVAAWRALPSDEGAAYDRTVTLNVGALPPMITFGTNPAMVMTIVGRIPDPSLITTALQRQALEKALAYMGLQPGEMLLGHPIDVVFLGSCTNGRMSDLRAAAAMLKGRKVAAGVRMLVVPGSEQIKRQAESEGLDRIFKEAGAQWREPGCSMCIGMNGDTIQPGQFAVSTSNRNFEGRQGKGGRTLLASPLTAVASAVAGSVADPRTLIASRLRQSSVLTARRSAAAGTCVIRFMRGLHRGSARTLWRRRPPTIPSIRSTMEPYKPFRSRLLPLPIDNIDTDQIYPGRFLTVTSKDGLAKLLFADWRYNPDGTPKPDFVLNQPGAAGAQILLAGDNFGCGSSREHAPWALTANGFRAVISTSFADIFRNNALKNGLVPIIVDQATHRALFALVQADPQAEVEVDLAIAHPEAAGRRDRGVPHRSLQPALPAGWRG